MSDAVEDLGPLPYTSKVEAMAGYGLSASDIANVLDIDVGALKASYGKQLTGGQIKANARVAESLYRKAIGEGRESVTAAIFWLKTRAHWKETTVHEQRFTHDDFILSLDEGAKRFTSKMEELVARVGQER
jgi:hypothetical protein